MGTYYCTQKPDGITKFWPISRSSGTRKRMPTEASKSCGRIGKANSAMDAQVNLGIPSIRSDFSLLEISLPSGIHSVAVRTISLPLMRQNPSQSSDLRLRKTVRRE